MNLWLKNNFLTVALSLDVRCIKLKHTLRLGLYQKKKTPKNIHKILTDVRTWAYLAGSYKKSQKKESNLLHSYVLNEFLTVDHS